jgi:hypothetical protein
MSSFDRSDERAPSPPSALARRMQSALDDASVGGSQPSPEAAMEAALSLLDSLARDPEPSRRGALSLLAADALVTYAFENAANVPDGLEDRAADAMRRITRVAAEHNR